jgi:hypothetical protein
MLPYKFIFNTDYTFDCQVPPAKCYPGYTGSKGIYSNWNAKGYFGPNNPYGPPGTGSTTQTLMWDTTAWVPPWDPGVNVPRGTAGDNVVDTTEFGGKFDFDRGGIVEVIPGTNRFGGTMRLIYGPNQAFYVTRTNTSPYIFGTLFGLDDLPYTDYQPIQFDNSTHRTYGFRNYRLTANNISKATTGPPDYGYVTSYVQTFVLDNPWSTGAIVIYQPNGYYITTWTLAGYDNRTPAGEYGTVSMVRPRMLWSYLAPFNPLDPISQVGAGADVWEFKVKFLGIFTPEPDRILLLGAGIVTLVVFVRMRRR